MGRTPPRRLFMETSPESRLRPRFILWLVQSRPVETNPQRQLRRCDLPHRLSQRDFLDCPSSSEILEDGLPLWHRRRFANSSGRSSLEAPSEEVSMASSVPPR